MRRRRFSRPMQFLLLLAALAAWILSPWSSLFLPPACAWFAFLLTGLALIWAISLMRE